MQSTMFKTALLALAFTLSASAAHAFVRVGNCDDVTHVVDVEVAGEQKKITLAPGEHQQIFAWPVRLKLEGKESAGFFTPRQARQLDEYCVWGGELRFQRRRTALWR